MVERDWKDTARGGAGGREGACEILSPLQPAVPPPLPPHPAQHLTPSPVVLALSIFGGAGLSARVGNLEGTQKNPGLESIQNKSFNWLVIKSFNL